MQPLTRKYLRGLKPQKDEEERIEMVGKWVKKIYEFTHYYAERNSETYYKFPLQSYSSSIEFLKENMGTILEKLQELFPDSNIYYDVANSSGKEETCIVINWT